MTRVVTDSLNGVFAIVNPVHVVRRPEPLPEWSWTSDVKRATRFTSKESAERFRAECQDWMARHGVRPVRLTCVSPSSILRPCR